MSITQDKVDLPNLSLPSKPAPSLASRLAPGPSSLHPKLNFALPPKPTGPPPSSSSFSPSTNTRGITSPSPPLRERNDFYRPFSPPRSLSPPPRVREYTDSYIPSPSPPRRYRSPTPPRRRYSRSLVKRRRSPSPSFSRSRSVTLEVEDPTPRTTFYTHSHRKEEALELKRQKIEERNEAREKAKKEKEDQWAEYQKRRSQLDQELDQTKPSTSRRYLAQPSLPSTSTTNPSKSIPTGPRAQSGLAVSVSRPGPSTRPSAPSSPSLPTGPRALTGRPVPTGPRVLTASYSTQAQLAESPPEDSLPAFGSNKTRASRSSSRTTSESKTRSVSPGSGISKSDEDMPSTARSPRTNSRTARRKPAYKASNKQLEGPLRDQKQIMEEFGKGAKVDPKWADNPKSRLIVYWGSEAGGDFTCEEGVVDGKQIYRMSVVGDSTMGIIGQGDSTKKKDAEKLAATSALLQLEAAGVAGGKAVNPISAANQSGSNGEKAKLSDGSEIIYDRARQFMEYYCQRYKFGKPDIDFSQSTHKSGRKGKSSSQGWDAVITVGGRKIGMGSAGSKKGAQIKCYLDVTQYLESCDAELWKDFLEHSKKDSSANMGMAPHLVFQMSDNLNEDIYGLCGDIRQSILHKNAPPVGIATEPQPLPVFTTGRLSKAGEAELEDKSRSLQDKLAAYQNDPQLEKMRAQRQSLPVTTKATDILAKIEVNDVTIVMAATGSGKTTQVPQLLFDDYINRGEGAKCNIICTQPRRLAATSVAERIADERGDRLGNEIGYQVRFDAQLPRPNGSITFCTTGIFLKRMQSALGATANQDAVAAMDAVTHIVVDEVHERDIDTDLLLVVLKRLLADRKDRDKPVKIVLMSATIDPTLFQNYFIDSRGRPAPIAEVPGRTFPVERHYLDDIVSQIQNGLVPQSRWVFRERNVVEYLQRELSQESTDFGPNTGMDLEIPYPLVALSIAHVIKKSDDGHVLVFLPGWDEIKKTADILLDPTNRYPLLGIKFSDTSKYSVHYLHSTIPAAEQKEVFRPPPKGVRRIILATNIAETSVTIPDVVYVVDTARVKEKRYDPDRHMSSLVSAWVGSSNLNQRAGRAGRHREGEYYGLVSRNRMNSLDPHQTVEMKRSDLSNVVMHVKALNLGEVEDVLAAVIEPPEPSRIVAAMQVLRMLGALDAAKNLTSLGRVLLQLPVEAAIGKLCLFGSVFRCLDSALTLAAVLTNRDPFLAPLALKKEADDIKNSWSPLAFRSDPLAIVAAYNTWTVLDDIRDYYQANQFCQANFLSKPTLLQIKKVKGSLLQSLDQAGIIAVSAGGSVGRIGRRTEVPIQLNQHGQSLPLLAALIAMASAPNFAIRTSEKTCRTAQDKTVFIHAASVNSRRREAGGPEGPSASFNPAEKRLYAFGEKGRNVPLGGKESSAITQLRTVTRLDPMTYMLFGAYELVVTQRGLECDSWLPVMGNLHALDDIQRLKTLLDGCMLRVFEGVGKSLVRGRDQRWVKAQDSVDVQAGSSRIGPAAEEGDEGENESDDEGEVEKKRVIEPMSMDEIKELELLTTDVVRILDAYAAEREGGSTVPSRPATPGAGMGNGNGQGVYRPPGAGGRRW